MGICVCVTLCERVGQKGVSMTSQRLSWRPNRLPATAFKVALCVLHYHRATQTGTMNPCCNILYGQPRFLTYIYNLHAYITKKKWVSTGKNVMCDSSGRQRGAQLWQPLSLTSSWNSSSLSARLIWSTVCLLTVDTTVLQQPCRLCARQDSPSASPHNWHIEHCLQISSSISPEMFFINALQWYIVLLSCETVSCEYFSAPLPPQEIPELHLTVPESWNLLSEVVCQDKSFLPPAHSRWAGVQSTQSLASSCESRQGYCQSSCWR